MEKYGLMEAINKSWRKTYKWIGNNELRSCTIEVYLENMWKAYHEEVD